MMDPIAITKSMSDTIFSDVVSSAPRKTREVLFSQLGIKAKKPMIGLDLNRKRDERARQLHERLKSSTGKRENDVCRELIRTWLFTQRPLLKAALDFVGVPNDNGLVETETDFFKDLSPERITALKKHLYVSFNPEHVDIYMRFVEIPEL